MSTQPETEANDIVIQINTGTVGVPVWTTVASMTAQSMRFGRTTVEITSTSSSQWRELLDGGGVRSMTIAGSGIWKNSTGQAALLTMAYDELALRQMKFILPEVGDFVSLYQMTDLETSGDANENIDFSATFESAGAPTFTAAA